MVEPATRGRTAISVAGVDIVAGVGELIQGMMYLEIRSVGTLPFMLWWW